MNDKILIYIILKDLIEEPTFNKIVERFKIDKEACQKTLEAAKPYVEVEKGGNTERILQAILPLISGNSTTYTYNECLQNISREYGFPVPDATSENMLEVFEKHVQNLQNNTELTLSDFSESLFYLAKLYLSNTYYKSNPQTISYFEYLKSLIAFANCIIKNDLEKEKFILLCCDLSGIQSFIYDIYARKAAKSLKGRSFYLQLLTDTLIQTLIHESDVSIANLIYSSGGKFYLLLPNTEIITQKIQIVEQEVIEKLFAELENKLYLCMDFISFDIEMPNYVIKTEENYLDKNISGIEDLWAAVSSKAARKKQRKFESFILDSSNFQKMFRGEGLEEEYNGEDNVLCAVTGSPTKKDAKYKLDDDVYVKNWVWKQTKIGEDLKDAVFFKTIIQKNYTSNDNWINPLDMNVYYSLKVSEETKPQPPYTYINPDSDFLFVPNGSFMYYGGSKQAIDKQSNEWKTYDKLTEGVGFKRLGVLRMDVDNLGQVFTSKISSLGKKYASFAAFSDLSARIDWFFSGYLNTLRNHSEYEDWINIIYAGGDDLFIVGRWDKVIDFAYNVRKEFSKYVMDEDHTAITLSGGMVLVGAKFPIAKAADMAKNALDAAKDFFINPNARSSDGEPTKNAITFLNETISWKEEFPFVNEMRKKFSELLQSKLISAGFIYKMYFYKALKDANKPDWKWQSAYNIGRRLQNAKAEDKVFLRNLQNAFFTENYNDGTIRHHASEAGRMLDLLCIAARWAEYLQR